jgi:penicillin-binding protein 1A
MTNMTGGTLPAQTWHEVMAFAHQNLEIHPIPGLAPEGNAAMAFASSRSSAAQANQQSTGSVAPGTLSRRSLEAVGGIGALFQKVGRPDQASKDAPPASTASPGPRVAMP